MDMDEVIRFQIEVDGTQPIKEFSNINEASKTVVESIDQIQKKTNDILPGTDTFFQESKNTIYNSANRINEINRTISTSPFFSEKQLSDLYKERDLLVRGIEATYKDVLSFSKASANLTSGAGQTNLTALSSMLPQLLSFVSDVSDFQKKANTLMDTAVFKAGIKNKISEAGLFEKLGFSKNSSQADFLADYLMYRGAAQTQRKGFMSHIIQGAEDKTHIYESFEKMLPAAFQSFHDVKGSRLVAQNGNQKLSAKETKLIENLLISNPYFAQAAEQSGIAARLNGKMRVAGGLTRNDINSVASNLYDTIVESAKGMAMYGITDVDNPDYWERIARKTNKPFLGSMSSARTLSDNFEWLTPGRSKRKNLPNSAFYDVGDIAFSPNVRRYEVAKYSLSDLRNGVNLNGKERLYDKNSEEHYFALDNSLHLEKILSSGNRKGLPKHNASIDDLFYLELDPRLARPDLSEDERRKLEEEYARYIEQGITKQINGKDTHFTFTRAHKSLGLEFVNDIAYNAITNNGKDKSFFRGGLRQSIFENSPDIKDTAYQQFAKAVEYASKNATSGESIQELFGTRLPDELKIAIFDLEEAAKNGNDAAGMNGQSYINKKYVPTGFQARMPGIKTALNTIDPRGFLSYFGGAVKTLGPNGEIETITGDEDLILSWTDIKNAGIKYKDENGKMLSLAEIKKNINREFKEGGGKIFAARTMDDANGKVHWLSGQFAQNLKGDKDFVDLTTKAFLDEYVRAGTLEGALSSVFSGDSETRDLLLATNGAALSDRRIQERISEYRQTMLSRISKGDVMLPRELASQRAMAAPWLFNAIISGAKGINKEGTGLVKQGESSYFDYLYDNLSAEQKSELNLITMKDDEVAFQNILASTLGIGRYPATSRSARKVDNVLASEDNRAKAIKQALKTSGFDPNAFYIAPSSPIMDMLQDADFDGDVMELIGLAYTGQTKSGKQVTAAEILNRAFDLGMKRIDQSGISKEEAEVRKSKLRSLVFSGDKFSMDNGRDVMKVISAMMQDGVFMGAPNAVLRNASQIPWDSTVLKAMADAESQYSINSVRGKKGYEMASSKEEIAIMTKYRPFQEFFHLVDSNRNQYGNIDESKLIEASKASDGLAGSKFWNTNLPFHTMSASARQGLLGRYFLKQRGIDINKDYNWDYIFDTVLGKKDESTALGRMQSALRDVWMGYLNADYLAVDDEVIAKLGDLRGKAIDEQQALVKADRDRLGSAYDKTGSNLSIATNIVDRLGGRVISNAVAGMALSSGKMNEGDNASIFETLQRLGMPNLVGTFDFSNLLLARTSPDAFKNMEQSSGGSEMYRLIQQFNLLNTDQKKKLIDNMPRLSYSTMEKLAYDPMSFLKMVIEGKEQEVSSPAVEIGQASHAAIEHFMKLRMGSQSQLTDDQLKTAQQEALSVFDEYLGLKDQEFLKNEERSSRGLNEAERKDLRTQGSKLNQRYNKLRQFLSSSALLDIYPENEWQVVGIESSDVGNDELASGNRMKLHGFGTQLTNNKEIGFTGAYDLRFRNRSSGREVVADMKNYWDPTTQDWEKWRVQQELYVNQLIKNGVPVDEIGIIMPYQKETRTMAFNKSDLEQNFDNVKRSVQAIQNFSETEATVQSFLELSKFVRETMFGDAGKDFGAQYKEWSNKKTSEKINPNMISDALLMHDKYREAVEAEEDINKFVNQRTRPRDKVFMDSQLWGSKFGEAETIKAQSELERRIGNDAKADDLEARYSASIGTLNQGLATAAYLDEQEFGENVLKNIKGNSGTSQINNLIDEYKGFRIQKDSNANKRELLKTRITAGEENIKNLENEAVRLSTQKEDINKEQEYVKFLQWTNEKIKGTDDLKEKKLWRDTRDAYIERHNDISYLDEYGSIRSASENQNEDALSELLSNRKTTLDDRLRQIDNLEKENKEELSKNKADVSTLNMGLIASKTLSEANEEAFAEYEKQVEKTATDIVANTLDALASSMGQDVSKPMDLSAGRSKFIENIQNTRTDILNLLSENIITEDQAVNMLSKANVMLTDESLLAFDQEQIKNAKKKLGMTSTTPHEQAEDWYKQRKSVLDADTDVKRRAMMTELNKADDEFQSVLGTGTEKETEALNHLIDLTDRYNNINKDEDEQLKQRRDEIETRINKQREDSLDEYTRSIKGESFTPEELIDKKVYSMKNKLMDFRDKLGLDDPMVSRINDLLKDDKMWSDFADRLRDADSSQADIRKAAEQNALINAKFQAEMVARQQQQAFDRYNRTRYGQSTSRIINAYRSQVDYRDNLQNTIDTNRNKIETTSNTLRALREQYKSMGEGSEKKALGAQIQATEAQLSGYKNALQGAEQQMQKFSKSSMLTAAGFSAINSGIQMLVSRLGRQLFQKALAEAKKFVKEFNQTMTEIQMITLKSDSAMSTLGDGLIAKAKELKISISEISKSAATLYRQGLSDEEVNERLDVISKFSKVSGTKVEDATKLVTIAMNTGLVSNAMEASDIVTALGDNAATNAAQIEKGIEKAGAAAAADGTTFGQLAAMLTAITSTTQIGGNVAGRTLNTIFGRMNKIGTNELIYDENGNAVSGSAVSKLLAAQGIQTYDTEGNKRSSYDVLYELSQKWDSISDAEQQQLANAIAGTRQYSNFAAIMQGMSEGKVDEYMKLIGESSGITDQKYEIYTESLAASLTNLQNVFDGLVNDLVSSGVAGDIVDGLANIVQGIDNIVNSAGGLPGVLAALIPIATLMIGLKSGSFAGIAIGLGTAAISGIALNAIGSQQSAAERNSAYETESQKRLSSYDGIDRLKELRNTQNRTAEENQEYANLTNKFAQNLGLTNSSAGAATYSIEALTSALSGLGKGADDAADRVINEVEEAKKAEFASSIANTRGDTIDELTERTQEETKEANRTLSLGNTLFNGRLWDYNPETGYTLRKDAIEKQNELVRNSQSNDAFFGLAGTFSTLVDGKQRYSYNNDVEDPLVDFYYNASIAGRMGEEEKKTTREQWSNRLKGAAAGSFEFNPEWTEAAFDYINSPDAVNTTAFTSGENVAKDVLTRKLGRWYSQDQIDYLAHQMTLDWYENRDWRSAYNNVVGTGTSYNDIKKSVDKSLEGYVATSAVSKMPYGLADVGENGYYEDSNGKRYTAEEVQKIYDTQKTQDRNRAISIMQEHNTAINAEYDEEVAKVTEENARRKAEADAENARRAEEFEEKARQDRIDIENEYKENLLTEGKRLYSTSGTSQDMSAAEMKYFKDFLLANYDINIDNIQDERLRARHFSLYRAGAYGGYASTFEAQPKDVQDEYIAATAANNWDSLSAEEQDYWYEMARDVVSRRKPIDTSYSVVIPELLKKPEFDESKLIGGANATAEALGELYDNGEILEDVAKEIEEANKKAREKEPDFIGKTNRFVDSLKSYEQEQGWLTKNQVGTSSDTLVGMLLNGNFGEGATGLDAFMQFINSNVTAEGAWNQVIASNQDLQRVMHQAHWDTQSLSWEAPEDIMSQLLNAMYGSSLTYGSQQLTVQQRAAIAQEAFNGLTGETPWYISPEELDTQQENAWAQYQKTVLEPYNQAMEQASKTYTGESLKQAQDQIRSYYNPATTKEEFLSRNPGLTTGAMSQQQQTYLKEALGDQLYQKVVSKKASPEELAYASTILQNRNYGLTSLTAGQTLSGIQDVRAAIKEGRFGVSGGYSTEIANEFMSGWSGWGEYSALVQKQNALQPGQTLSDKDLARLQILNESLDNFEKNAQIKFELEGIQELENAGKIAAGTSSQLEKLRNNSTVALEILLDYQVKGYESGQQRARLRSSEQSQQDEAAMAILNMGRDQYYADRQANYQSALAIDEQNQAVDAETWWQRYNAEGLTEEQRTSILRSVRSAGFTLTRGQNSAANGFVYTGSAITDINPLIGKTQNYSDAELNRTLDKILAGKVERITEGEAYNADLYDAAVSSAGVYTQELLRRQANEEYVDPWLQIASDNERSAYQLQTITGYSSRTDQARKAQYAIDNYNGANAGTIASFLNINEADVKRLMETDEGKIELETKLKEQQKVLYSEMAESLGFSLNTSDMSSMKSQIQTAADNATGMLKEFLQWVADSIDEGTGFLFGETEYSSFEEVVTQNLLGTTKTKAAMNEVGALIASENRDYAGLLANKNVDWNALDQGLLYMLNSRAKGNDSFTDQIIDETYANALYGRKSSPETQQRILSDLFGGNLSAENMVSTYRTWMEDQEKYAGEIKAYESLDGISEVTEALSSEENAAEKTAQAVEEYNKQVGPNQINYLKKYGESTEDVAETVSNLTKSTKTATAQQKAFMQSMSGVMSNQYYRQRWKSGDRSSQTKQVISSMLGISKEDLDIFSEELINSMIDSLEKQDLSDLETTANGYAEVISQTLTEKIGDQTIILDGVPISVNSGSVTMDVSTAQAELAGLLSEKEQEFLAMLQSWGIDAALQVDGTGDKISAKIVINGLGNGRKGGGGGGGGKSAVDKLLESQKFKVQDIEHQIKMVQVLETQYQNTGEYGAYLDALETEIELQTKRRDIYKENIAEMEKERKGKAQDSDDYKKLTESIWSAQEAVAEYESTILDLNKKKLDNLLSQFESLDQSISHAANMADLFIKRFTALEKWSDVDEKTYELIVENVNKQRQSQQKIDEVLRPKYNEAVANYGSESQIAKDIQKQIDAEEENILSLGTENISLYQGVGSSRIDRAATELERNTVFPNAISNIAGTYAQYAETHEDWASYRKWLRKQATSGEDILAQQERYLADLQVQLAGTAKDDHANRARLEAEIAKAQEEITNTQINNASIQSSLYESLFTELTKSFSDLDQETQHLSNIFAATADIAKKNENWEAYRANIQGNIGVLRTEQQNQEIKASTYDAILSFYEDVNTGKGLSEDTTNKLMGIGLSEEDISVYRQLASGGTLTDEERSAIRTFNKEEQDRVDQMLSDLAANENVLTEEEKAAERNRIADIQAEIDARNTILDLPDGFIPEETIRSIRSERDAAAENALSKQAEQQSLYFEFFNSKITQQANAFEDLTRETNHLTNMFSQSATLFRQMENWSSYRDSIAMSNEERFTYIDQLDENISKNQALLNEALSAPEGTIDPESIDTLKDTINRDQEARLKTLTEIHSNIKAYQQSMIDQATTIANRLSLLPQTLSQMAGINAQIASANADYNGFREATKESMQANAKTDMASILEAQMLLRDLSQITEPQERENAMKRLSQIAINLENSRLTETNNAASIRKSYLTEISDKYTEATKTPNMINSLVQPWIQQAQQNYDYNGQRALLQMQIMQQNNSMAAAQAGRSSLLMDLPKLYGTPQYKEAIAQLNGFVSSISSAKLAINALNDAIAASKVEELLTKFSNAMQKDQTNMGIASQFQNVYQGARQWDRYREMIQYQIDASGRLMDENQKKISSLMSALNDPEIQGSSQAYNKVIDEIYSAYSEKASLTVGEYNQRVAFNDSFATEAIYNYTNAKENDERYTQMAMAQANRFLNLGDIETYKKAMDVVRQTKSQALETDKMYLETFRDTLANMESGTPGYEELAKKYKDLQVSIFETDMELKALNDELQNNVIDKMLERMNRQIKVAEHGLTMLTAVMDLYQTKGELTNVNTMLEKDNELLEREKEQLEVIIEELEDYVQVNIDNSELEAGSDAYWKIEEALMGYEEQLEKVNNEIAKNTKQIRENQLQILKLKQTLEDTVKEEIEYRIETEKKMLSATVSLQNTILETIRQQYRDRWEIYRKDLEKQKEALNEERNLLNKRLQMRKDAMNQQDELSQIEELRRQLALISGDSSRTKEVRELRKQISDLEKNRAMSIAEAEVSAEAERLDDQINAIDEKIEFDQEKLDRYLEDANNFKEQVGELLSGSFDDMVNWLRENNKEFANSLAEGKTQMIQTWEDTWNQMINYVETFWEQINNVLSSAESFMSFMIESDKYLRASETGRAILQETWGTQYEDYTSALIDTAENYEHTHNVKTERDVTPEDLIDVLNSIFEPESRGVMQTPDPTFAGDHKKISDNSTVEDIRETLIEHIKEILRINKQLIDEQIKELEKLKNEAFVENSKFTNEEKVAIISDALTDIKYKTETAADSISQMATDARNEGNTMLADYFDAMTNTLEDFFKTRVPEWGEKLREAQTASGEEQSQILNSLGTEIVEGSQSILQESSNILGGMYENVDEMLAETSIEMLADIGNSLTDYGASIGGAGGEVIDMAAALKDDGEATVDSIESLLTEIRDIIKDCLEKYNSDQEQIAKEAASTEETKNDIHRQALENIMNDQAEMVVKAANDQAETVVNAANNQADTVVKAANNQADTVVKVSNDQADTVVKTTNNQAETVVKAANNQAEIVVKAEQAQAGNVSTYVGTASSQVATNLTRAGTDMVKTMGKFADQMKTYKDAIESYYDSVVNGASTPTIQSDNSSSTIEGLAGQAISAANSASQTIADRIEDMAGSLPTTTVVYGDGSPSSSGSGASGSPSSGGGGSGGSGGSGTQQTWDVYDDRGFKTNYTVSAGSIEDANKEAQELSSHYTAATHTETPTGTKYYRIVDKNNTEHYKSLSRSEAENRLHGMQNASPSMGFMLKYYKEGGLVDYTGPAWVDGTKTKPEAFLSNIDFENIKALTDALNTVSINSWATPNLSDFLAPSQTFGDINVVINQAELKSDADIEEVAKRVGKAFTKQLSRQGMQMNAYSF